MTKQPEYTEVDAMRDTNAALAKLNEDGDAQRRIIQWLNAKFTGGGSQGSLLRPSIPDSSASERPEDIKSFMMQKRPMNNYERVACLAFYLEKFKEMSDVGTQDIVEANTEARLPRMSNPALFIKHATHTYGYLNSLGQRRLAVSGRGEALVEALPDRAKVESALTDFPFGRKRRTQKKATKAATAGRASND